MPQALAQHLHRLLGPLPPAAAAACASAQPHHLSSGAPLLHVGETWRHLWWVERGAFRLYYLERDGHAANKNFYLDGAMFWPITPALASTPSSFCIEALEPSLAWALPCQSWMAAVQDWAPWTMLERKVLIALLEDKMQREQQFLQRTATERYQTLVASQPVWAERIALRHLASYLGITDVALSRIRRRLNPG